METGYKKWRFKFNEVRAGCYENVAYRVSGHQVAANGLEDACYTILLLALEPGSFNGWALQLLDGEDKFVEIGCIKAIVIAVINPFISLLLQNHAGGIAL